jgi:TRAP-type C4-dicarboxylate transport system substrate-binding protein|nr:MAG: C4-dicarboxylate ABC transporter substrate-binding protein [Pseudomonadota bacterium]
MRAKAAAAAGALGLALLATPGPVGAAETISLRIGAGHPAASTWITTIREIFMPRFAERVKAETNYEIQWTEAWGGSVCKLGECLEAVESGLLDMGELQTPFEPAKLMAQNFSYFVPFGTGDPILAAELNRRTYEEVPALKQMLEERYNQVFVGVGILSNYGLVTTFQWDKVEDLKGQKIAAAGPNIPWVQSVGVVPVQSNLNEAYTSFQTGVYHGWVMFPDGVTSFRLEEVTKQFTITGFGAIATPLLTINKDTWDSLPPEVQKIMLEVGAEWNKRAGEFTAERQKQALAKMKEAGLRIKELTFEEKKAWAAKLPNIPKERYEEMKKLGQPGEAVYHYIKLLKEAGHEFPRDWEAER